ncbi:hypothetical protein HALLA_09345 [Halostagnicola larsenii XH-48]|uniref:Flagellin n=1 Tax=Halostagnicola larsenii XH-48 TaxID=797299 RepID=W0JPX4_9EURY|nr:hypothetical protein [Halostagnicola larsenii]AHF99047.1 hypothetical protein HALLA_09345 [Halostagnicola larsenii XH-48]
MTGFRRDDRAISIALTHALTLGIATVLVATLLVSAGVLLEGETDRSVRESLETTGERLAADVLRVDGLGTAHGTTDEATVTVDYPETAANSRYRVAIVDCDELEQALSAGEYCLELTAQATGQSVSIPLGELEASVDADTSVRGGTIAIGHDGEKLGVWNP